LSEEKEIPRRKSMPTDHQQLLTVTFPASVGRSNSFKMPKSTSTRLSPDSAEGGVSKSLPTTPVELDVIPSTEQASPSTTGGSLAAGGTQRAKTTWSKVKDIVTTARRGSTDAPTTETGVVDGRSSSVEPCRVFNVVDDEADPWVEKRPRGKQATSSGRDDRGRSSVSPPRTSKRQQDRKRFSVSHATSTSVAVTTLTNSPLDLAGLLGM